MHAHSTTPAAITIRPVEPGDTAALQEFFETLEAEDRWRRFANAYHPPLSFVATMTLTGERGGARLVAVLADRGGVGPRIVGEAGYELTTDGDGDFSMTVGTTWQPVVAAALLDTVLQVAAGAGVANLEIEVHRDDRLLRDLLAERGAMIAEHEGWVSTRLRLGTGTAQVSWPAGHDRPRLLIEGAGGRWPLAEAARSMGYDVLSCPGPERGTCPALEGEECVAAATADAIVMARPTDHPCWPRLRAAHRRLHPDVPVSYQPQLNESAWNT